MVNIGSETGTFVLKRYNMIFATDYLTFMDEDLSIDDNQMETMRPFQIEGNPYLQISNLKDDTVHVEIFTVTGQNLTSSERYKNNTIDISDFENGIYFIKLSSLNNQQKVFKFLKN